MPGHSTHSRSPHVVWQFYAHCNQLALQFTCDDVGLGVCTLVEAMFLAVSESPEKDAEFCVWMEWEVSTRQSSLGGKPFQAWSFYITADDMSRELEAVLHTVVSKTPGWKAVGRVPDMPQDVFPIFEFVRGELRAFFARDDRPAEIVGVFYPDIYYANGLPRFGLVRLPKPYRNSRFRTRGGFSPVFKVRYADEINPRFIMPFDRTEKLHPCSYTEKELEQFVPHWNSYSEEDKGVVRLYGMPQSYSDAGEPTSFDLTKPLREKFPDHMDPAICAVYLTYRDSKCVLEIVREDNGQNVFQHEDLSIYLDTDSLPTFDVGKPLLRNVRHFLEYFDPLTIINTLDLFPPLVCDIVYDEYCSLDETFEEKARRRLELEDELERLRLRRILKSLEQQKLAQIKAYLNDSVMRDLYTIGLRRGELYRQRISDAFYREEELCSMRKQHALSDDEKYELDALGEFLDDVLSKRINLKDPFDNFLLYCDLKRSGTWDELKSAGILENVVDHFNLAHFYDGECDE